MRLFRGNKFHYRWRVLFSRGVPSSLIYQINLNIHVTLSFVIKSWERLTDFFFFLGTSGFIKIFFLPLLLWRGIFYFLAYTRPRLSFPTRHFRDFPKGKSRNYARTRSEGSERESIFQSCVKARIHIVAKCWLFRAHMDSRCAEFPGIYIAVFENMTQFEANFRFLKEKIRKKKRIFLNVFFILKTRSLPRSIY